MDFQKLFLTICVILLGAIGIFSIITYWNTSYGTTVAAGFNNTEAHLVSMTSTTVNNVSDQTGNATLTQSGAGSSSSSSNLINRALNVITILPSLLGLPPAMLQDAAIIMGVPPIYISIGTAVFLFAFALTLAYLLIIGIRGL